MKRVVVSLVTVLALASLVIAGCAQAAPAAPTPTKAPVATKAVEPTKASVPTKVAAAASAAAPSKSDFPQKGKSISIIIGYGPGGGADIISRALAPLLEKDLGVPFVIVNKPGAAGQVAMTDVAMAKPDGYTIGFTNLPPIITNYLDPQRKAVYNRQSFIPVALHSVDPATAAVLVDSPYKTIRDLIDGAKATPEKIKAGTGGILGTGHLALLQTQRTTGTKFATVHFEGVANQIPALLGGHTDVAFDTAGNFLPYVKAGQVRLLGIMDSQESPLFPGVPTMESEGFKLYMKGGRGFHLPAGVPKEVVGVLSEAFKKAILSESHKEQMEKSGLIVGYKGPDQFASFWEEMETQLRGLDLTS